MYQQHFGLSEFPFGLTPDTGYFYRYPDHQEALNVLLVALRLGEGFIKVTGEVGTGKTLICRKLLNTLSSEGTVTAYLPNPCLPATALRHALADELANTHNVLVSVHPSDLSEQQHKTEANGQISALFWQHRQFVVAREDGRA